MLSAAQTFNETPGPVLPFIRRTDLPEWQMVYKFYYMQLSLADSGLDFHVTASCHKDCVRNSVSNKDKKL